MLMYYNLIIITGLRKIQVDVGEVVFKDFEYDLVHFVFINVGFFRQCTPDIWKVFLQLFYSCFSGSESGLSCVLLSFCC